MAERTFCTIEDLEGYEGDILDLSEIGHFNKEMTAARKEIEDRLIIGRIIEDLDKLGEDIKPRQLRTPSIFLTLEMIFSAATLDEESPYAAKATYYGNKFEAVYSSISVLDLDSNEDGTIQEGEQNIKPLHSTRMRRR